MNRKKTRRTGMPELVLMPAPVITTTFRAFHRVFAISCSKGSQPGSTCVVGIVTNRPRDRASEKGEWTVACPGCLLNGGLSCHDLRVAEQTVVREVPARAVVPQDGDNSKSRHAEAAQSRSISQLACYRSGNDASLSNGGVGSVVADVEVMARAIK